MKRLRFRSPKFEDASIEVPAEVSRLSRPFKAGICSPRGDEYRIENNIIRLDEGAEWKKTPAQHTNFWKATTANYEHLWRVNALSWLSGETFPFEREQELLAEWCSPKPGELVLDAACSTALYGRFLLQREPSLQVYAVDFSPLMLEEARKAFSEARQDAFLVCANVEQLPFWAASFDLIVCGGSLNEFADPQKALYEMRRVLVPEGRVFLMYLTESPQLAVRLLQRGASLGGLQFFKPEAAVSQFERAGFKVRQRAQHGIVAFALLEAV